VEPVFSPEGWDSLARGNAPGWGYYARALKGRHNVRRAVGRPFRANNLFPTLTQGCALG